MVDNEVPLEPTTAEGINQHLVSEMTVEDVNDVPPPPEEQSDEEQRQVAGIYEAMLQLGKGVNHRIVCKAVGIYITSLMHYSTDWRAIIPGFMNQMDQGAGLALNHHDPKEAPDPAITKEVLDKAEAKRERRRTSKLKLIENKDGQNDGNQGSEEANSEDRGVEGEEG